MNPRLAKSVTASIGILLTGFVMALTMSSPAPGHAQQTFTGYPPAAYLHVFLACPGDKSCTQTDEFHLKEIPKGCCVLLVTNGNGRRTNEVTSYQIFLNGKETIPARNDRNTQAAVSLLKDNKIEAVITGPPQSAIQTLIAYDPRESE